MKNVSIVPAIVSIIFMHTMASATTHKANKLLEFVAQHSTEMAAYMHRSSILTTPKTIRFNPTPAAQLKKSKKSSQKNSRSSSPTTAEELAFISVKDSALGGYVPAQDLLAYCYATGTGTKINERLAFCWYLKAAISGSKSAIDSLVACFNDGIGVNIDPQISKTLKSILS